MITSAITVPRSGSTITSAAKIAVRNPTGFQSCFSVCGAFRRAR